MRKKLSALTDSVSAKVSSLKDRVSSYFDGKTALTTMFAGSVVSANILASKITAFTVPEYGLAVAPAGFLALGAAFLFTDTISELYGAEEAHKAVNGTVLAVLVSLGLVNASVAMPSAPFYEFGQEYAQILNAGTSISLASVLTMLVSQNFDVYVFDRVRDAGLPKWARNIGSTVTSQFVDTALFIALAFAVFPRFFDGTLTPLAAIPSLVVSQYLLKVGVAIADTPLFYLLTSGSE